MAVVSRAGYAAASRRFASASRECDPFVRGETTNVSAFAGIVPAWESPDTDARAPDIWRAQSVHDHDDAAQGKKGLGENAKRSRIARGGRMHTTGTARGRDGGGDPESNRRKRLCRPSHHHSATPPRVWRFMLRAAVYPESKKSAGHARDAGLPASAMRACRARRAASWARPSPTAGSSAGRPSSPARVASPASRYAIPCLRGCPR